MIWSFPNHSNLHNSRNEDVMYILSAILIIIICIVCFTSGVIFTTTILCSCGGCCIFHFLVLWFCVYFEILFLAADVFGMTGINHHDWVPLKKANDNLPLSTTVSTVTDNTHKLKYTQVHTSTHIFLSKTVALTTVFSLAYELCPLKYYFPLKHHFHLLHTYPSHSSLSTKT